MALAAVLFARVRKAKGDAMRTFRTRLRSAIAALLACALCALPSCASMGGGGMKGMFSDSPAVHDVSV
jgi:hypothetical protein